MKLGIRDYSPHSGGYHQLPCFSLSPTRVKRYHTCPREFKAAEIDKEKLEQKFDHVALFIGSGSHKGIEVGRDFVLKGEPVDIEQCVAAAMKEYDSRRKKVEVVNMQGTHYTDEREVKEDIARITIAGLQKIVIPESQSGLVGAEEKVPLQGIFPFDVNAHYDARIENDADGIPTIIVKDTKTAAHAHVPDLFEACQTTLYGLVDYFENYDAYAKRMEKRIMIEINQLLKDPLGDVVTYQAELQPEHFEAVRDLYLSTALAISKRVFPARPNITCKYDCLELAARDREDPERVVEVEESEELNARFQAIWDSAPHFEVGIPHPENEKLTERVIAAQPEFAL